MYKHILIATDGSELADKGIKAGVALAVALQARVTLVTVSEPWVNAVAGDATAMTLSSELREDYLEASAAEAARILAGPEARARAAGLAVQSVYVPERQPAEAILETAAERSAELIVMASHGRSGLRKLLLGSQTQAVVTRGSLPVLVVR